MSENHSTIAHVLEHLQDRQLISEQDQQVIARRLDQPEGNAGDPLYLQIFVGLGAWFSALSLIIFLGIAGLFDSEIITFILGTVILASAVGISFSGKKTFIEQLSLALALAGNALVLTGIGLASGTDIFLPLLITQAVICALVYPFYNNSIYRFLAPSAVMLLAVAWIFEEKALFCIHFLVAAELLLVGLLFLRRKRPAWLTPLAYSAAATLSATLLFCNACLAGQKTLALSLWPSSIVLASGLIYLYIHLARDLKQYDEPWLVLAIVSTVLLACFATPGILVIVGLLIIGHAQGDRILMLMASLLLPFFLVLFYYNMNVDLAYKSWVIAGSGALLLVVRYIATFCRSKEVLS